MKHILTTILLLINSLILFPQVILTIEGKEIIDTETGVSNGYIIPRTYETKLTFRNNILTSVNSAGYILQAGDEIPGVNNNKLDGASITGNRFTWSGTDLTSWTHALFTGYNIGVLIKYNYLDNTPNGIQRKSNGMTDVTGVVAYNIIKNPKVGIVVKGMNGVRIYNNTLYSEKTNLQSGRGLIDIHTNTDYDLNAPSTGVKVFNNIFYSKQDALLINVMDLMSLQGFASDYNVFYCEAGPPKFNAGGVVKSFADWQALGYDVHSVVINPEFNDFIDFVPAKRLDRGIDLGEEFSEGLAIDAVWSTVNPKTVKQNGIWQAGARIYAGEVTIEEPLESGTKIYPNPAYGSFYVLNNGLNTTYHTMKVYDMNGNMVMKRTIESGLNPITVPIYFASGLYSIALENNSLDRIVTKLLIIN